LAVCAISVLVSVDPPRSADAQKTSAPLETPFVETTGVTLVLLDVAVTDKDGMPLHGLTVADFSVTLNGRKRPIYSVDDLCPYVAEPSVVEPSSTEPPPIGDGSIPTEPEPERVSYVLYLDFGQLQIDGRAIAITEARRFIRETLPPGDRAILVAYSSLGGLRELTPWTGDRDLLLSALQSAETDPVWFDSFPDLFWNRIEQCELCCRLCAMPCVPDCLVNARDEYQHGRRSLKALKSYLSRLEAVPGRKALLLFHQNEILFPARFYPQVQEIEVGDHLMILDEVGAEATNSRTVVYPAYSGSQPNLFVNDTPRLSTRLSLPSHAVNLGANLADFTGGAYNRTSALLPELTGVAGRRSACVYRIAIEPKVTSRGKMYRAVVKVRGRKVPYRYRLLFLTEMDRWWRRVTAVLLDPQQNEGFPLATTLVPLGFNGKKWRAKVQVVFEIDDLLLIPSGEDLLGAWEVGGLLQRGDGGAVAQMLGVSDVRRKADESQGGLIVHERLFDLEPGSYHLRSFVRDRNSDSIGGAEDEVQLPKSGVGSIFGPILMNVGRTWIESSLPLWRKEDELDRAESTMSRTGPVRAPWAPVRAGESLEAHSWLCSARDAGVAKAPLRFVAAGDTPLYRFEVEERNMDGPCFEVVDRIETLGLATGPHAYHIRWQGDDRSVAFEIGSPEPGPTR
jgi:VWFA-related protein